MICCVDFVICFVWLSKSFVIVQTTLLWLYFQYVIVQESCDCPKSNTFI